MTEYTVTTNLLLNTAGFTSGLSSAEAAQQKLAASIQASMDAAGMAYTRADASLEGMGATQARVAAQSLASTGTMIEGQAALAGAMMGAGAAQTAAGAEMVAADERVVAANDAVTKSAHGMGGMGLLAVIGITLALGKMVKSAMAGDAQFASMKTALANMGLGQANAEFEKLANTNTKLGFYTTDTARSLQQFATITHNSSDAVRLNVLAMDIARAKHMDLASATSQVTMELRGASRGFAMYGVSLDNTLPKAQAIKKAMEEVQAKVKGQAGDYMTQAAGKVDALKASFGQWADMIGNKLLPVITTLLGLLQRFLPDIAILLGIATAVYTIIKAVELWRAAQIALAAADPWQLMLIAIAAIVAILVVLWNHFKPVRDIIVDIANVALHVFGDLVKIIGWAAEQIVKLFTWQLREILSLASHLPIVGKIAAKALHAMNTGIADIGKAADVAGNKINSFQSTIDKLRNAKISNPFAAGGVNPVDTSPINAKPIIPTPKPSTKAATAAAAAAKKIAAKYAADLKTLNGDIDKALATLKTTRQKGSDAISAIISSSIGEPSELEKAFDATKSTATTVLSEFDKLKKAIDDRMVGYAKADQAKVINNLNVQSSIMVDLVAQRDVLTKQLADADKLQTGTIDAMAKSLLDYGIAAGILQKSTTATVIRVIQTTSGAIVTTGNDALDAVGSITKALADKLTEMQTFTANIKTLQSRGLNTDYLKQLIGAGIASSGSTVSALATASNSQISVINDTYSKITGLSSDFANTTGANLYDAGITNLTAYIAGLKTQETAVETRMNGITANITAQMAAIVPMSANVGKDTATALLDNLAAYINDPKNQASVLKNATDLANQIKSILSAAMTPYVPTPVIPPPVFVPPPVPKPQDLVTAAGATVSQAQAGLNGLGGQKDLSNYTSVPKVTINVGNGAFVLDKSGNVITDPAKITATLDIGRVANARVIDL